jgi:hypothetical protein
MVLVRYILLCAVGYLIIRSFLLYVKGRSSSSDIHETREKSNIPPKKVSKETGEYIDYEEIKK